MVTLSLTDIQRIVVYIEGGLVKGVDRPASVSVEIVDLDTEGADEDDLYTCTMAEKPHWHSGYGGDWLD